MSEILLFLFSLLLLLQCVSNYMTSKRILKLEQRIAQLEKGQGR